MTRDPAKPEGLSKRMAEPMSDLQTIQDLNLSGKRVLVRADFDVPLTAEHQVASDRRIRAALPTIRHCLQANAKVVLAAHLGCPNGTSQPELSLRPIAQTLQRMLDGHLVRFVEDIGSWSAEDQHESEIILLENLRFTPGERNNDEGFAKHLASLAEIYVNDAFATCHRQYASTDATPRQFDESNRAVGMLVQRELAVLEEALDHPPAPVVAILGGVKIADKLDMVESMLGLADYVLIGGAMAHTFLQASGGHVGASHFDAEQLRRAKQLLQDYAEEIILPVDHVIARPQSDDQPAEDWQIEMADGGMPPDWVGVDIGPKTIARYSDLIQDARTVFWNGPLGKFEDEPFRRGTEMIARAVAASEGKSIVGGGETSQAIEVFDLYDFIDHVSTGGGAFLKYLQDRTLPALELIPQTSAAR